MPSNPQVFVETSVQIAKLLGTKEERTFIDQVLQQPEIDFITSHYVYMEYQRAIISDFAHVHRSFRQAKTMGEAMQLIFSGSRSYRPRSLARCGQIAGLVYGEQEVVSLRDTTILLELYLHRLLSRIFWRHIHPIEDAIDCDLIRNGTQRLRDRTFDVADRCRKETARCTLPGFLHENRSRLEQLDNYLIANPNVIKDQLRIERVLAAVQHDPINVLGQATC